jgi:hypothetical protein
MFVVLDPCIHLKMDGPHGCSSGNARVGYWHLLSSQLLYCSPWGDSSHRDDIPELCRRVQTGATFPATVSTFALSAPR